MIPSAKLKDNNAPPKQYEESQAKESASIVNPEKKLDEQA